jgi:hypothetical protein
MPRTKKWGIKMWIVAMTIFLVLSFVIGIRAFLSGIDCNESPHAIICNVLWWTLIPLAWFIFMIWTWWITTKRWKW